MKPAIAILGLILTALSVSFFLIACAAPAAPPPGLNPDEEEYKVYSAIIQDQFVQGHARIVIFSETSPWTEGSSLENVRQNVPEITQDLVDNFKSRNNERFPLAQRFTLPIPVEFISQADMQVFFKEDKGWELFYQKFPDSQGLLDLSRVGFNRAMDRALVYSGNQSYALAGAGFYYLLARQGATWTIVTRQMVWIS